MSKHKDVVAVFHETLKRYRGSRRQSGKGFGKMAKAASGPALREALEHARDAADTDAGQVRLIFAALGRKSREETCEVTDAHLLAARTMIEDLKSGPALDDCLAAEAASVEGYAAGRLAVLGAWASRLDLADALAVLDGLRAEAELSRDRLAALIEIGKGKRPSPPAAVPAMTPKQAALIGLR